MRTPVGGLPTHVQTWKVTLRMGAGVGSGYHLKAAVGWGFPFAGTGVPPTVAGSMRLSVKVVYACRVLAEIARMHGTGELAHAEELAKIESVPPNYLAQILSELREGGLITSRRGRSGGYALARSPEEISLFDITTLIEGDLLDLGSEFGGRSGRRVKRAWREVRENLEETTRRFTLDRLVSREFEEMYYI